MSIRQFEIWIADLNPRIGTEAGKTRPVLMVQIDLLNQSLHPSTIVCPITSNVERNTEILRVHLSRGTANLHQTSSIMIDQIRAIDNTRLTKKVGVLPDEIIEKVKANISIVLSLE